MDFKSRKHTIESLKEFAHKKDWQLLSEEYLGGAVKHDFICDKGHAIKKTIEHFLKGSGCQICSGKARLTIEDFVKAAAKNGWELLTKEYNGDVQILSFRCLKCEKEFNLKSSYLRGKNSVKNCPNCSPLKKKTIEEIKINAKEIGLECLSDSYVGIEKKLLWRCKNNHEWSATPNMIFNSNSRCPECKRFKNEAKIKFAFEQYFEVKFPKKSKIPTSYGFNLELDGFNADLNLAFEYNGEQHYVYDPRYYHRKGIHEFENQKIRDEKKIEYCQMNNICLVIIPFSLKTHEEVASHILDQLPQSYMKDKVRLIEALENYGFESDELDSIREKLSSINMTLQSNVYSGVGDKNLLIKCLKCKHEYLASHYQIKKMSICINCRKNKTFTIEELQKIASEKNIYLVSTNYVPQKKVTWKCQKGHIWEATPSSVKGTKNTKGTSCPECYGKHKTTIEDVYQLSESRGHKCLSKSISNRDSKLTFECRKISGELHVWESTFSSYQISKNGCVYCTKKKKYVASV